MELPQLDMNAKEVPDPLPTTTSRSKGGGERARNQQNAEGRQALWGKDRSLSSDQHYVRSSAARSPFTIRPRTKRDWGRRGGGQHDTNSSGTYGNPDVASQSRALPSKAPPQEGIIGRDRARSAEKRRPSRWESFRSIIGSKPKDREGSRSSSRPSRWPSIGTKKSHGPSEMLPIETTPAVANTARNRDTGRTSTSFRRGQRSFGRSKSAGTDFASVSEGDENLPMYDEYEGDSDCFLNSSHSTVSMSAWGSRQNIDLVPTFPLSKSRDGREIEPTPTRGGTTVSTRSLAGVSSTMGDVNSGGGRGRALHTVASHIGAGDVAGDGNEISRNTGGKAFITTAAPSLTSGCTSSGDIDKDSQKRAKLGAAPYPVDDSIRLENLVATNDGDAPVSPISLREQQARENPLYSPVDLSADPAPRPRDPSEIFSTEANPATVHTTSNSSGGRNVPTSTGTSEPQDDHTSAPLEKDEEDTNGALDDASQSKELSSTVPIEREGSGGGRKQEGSTLFGWRWASRSSLPSPHGSSDDRLLGQHLDVTADGSPSEISPDDTTNGNDRSSRDGRNGPTSTGIRQPQGDRTSASLEKDGEATNGDLDEASQRIALSSTASPQGELSRYGRKQGRSNGSGTGIWPSGWRTPSPRRSGKEPRDTAGLAVSESRGRRHLGFTTHERILPRSTGQRRLDVTADDSPSEISPVDTNPSEANATTNDTTSNSSGGRTGSTSTGTSQLQDMNGALHDASQNKELSSSVPIEREDSGGGRKQERSTLFGWRWAYRSSLPPPHGSSDGPRGSNRSTHSGSRGERSLTIGRSHRFRSKYLDAKGGDIPTKMSPADINVAETNPTTIATASTGQRPGEDSTALSPRSESCDKSGSSDSSKTKASLNHVRVPVSIGLPPPSPDDTKNGGTRVQKAHVKFDLPTEDLQGITHGSGKADRSTDGGNSDCDLEGDEDAVATSAPSPSTGCTSDIDAVSQSDVSQTPEGGSCGMGKLLSSCFEESTPNDTSNGCCF